MVSRVYYAMALNDTSPELLMPRGLVPLERDTSRALVAAGLPDLCRCVARRNFVVFVQADNVDDEGGLQRAITTAWQQSNQGALNKFSVYHKIILAV